MDRRNFIRSAYLAGAGLSLLSVDNLAMVTSGRKDLSKNAPLAIATSNFCGPQFRGMWRDVEWHQQHTQIIKASEINNSLKNTKLYKRLAQKAT